MGSKSAISSFTSEDDQETINGDAINTPKIVYRATEMAEKTKGLYQVVANICLAWVDNICAAANAEYEKISELYQSPMKKLNQKSNQEED